MLVLQSLLCVWFRWWSIAVDTKWASWQNRQNVCAPSEGSDQPRHPPRVFNVRMKKAWVLSYPLSAQRRLRSDWADAQADLSLRWAYIPFCWFYHEVAQIQNCDDALGAGHTWKICFYFVQLWFPLCCLTHQPLFKTGSTLNGKN